jgi:hypothetical protein
MQAVDAGVPPPPAVRLRGRRACVVHDAADAGAATLVVGVLRGAGVKVRAVLASQVSADAHGACRGAERVFLLWSAAAAGDAGLHRLRSATGTPDGDRLVVLPVDDTEVAPLLASALHPMLLVCLGVLGADVGGGPLQRLAARFAQLRRLGHWGALAMGIFALSFLVLAEVWRLPPPPMDATGQLQFATLMSLMLGVTSGIGVWLWAWLDRRFLAQRAASYLLRPPKTRGS